MAKKLNKKVVIIAIVFLTLCVLGGGTLSVMYLMRRNPERNLENARQALAAGDYESAERYFSRAFAYGKTDAWKIERLFEMADFHLINNEEHEANWPKALSCWNTVININTKNIPARRHMMQYFYEMADSGSSAAWKNVYDNTAELVEIIRDNGAEPDAELMTAYGRAALSIALRGGTTDRETYLDQAIETFESLLERDPGTASYYSYLADAVLLKGRLNAQAGFLNARQRAEEQAVEYLDKAVEVAEDKAAALAARYSYELQTVNNDPNNMEALRAELETRIGEVTPDAKLLMVLSQAYELPGNGSAEAELNRAIEIAQQAVRMTPDQFDHNYRLMLLLYRKGSAFEDQAAMQDAIVLAQEMLASLQSKIAPGPRQALNMAYRNAVHIFLSRCYLEKAFEQPQDAQQWIAKAEPLVDQTTQYYGSSEHVTVQQWQGILLLAKGERNKAIRLLYRAYEQGKALEVPDEPSNIDPVLCMVLARIAKEDGQIGLQREFLEKAMANRSRIILDKPSILLDYADLMSRFQMWELTRAIAQGYQKRYGANLQSQKLITDATLALGDNEEVTSLINALPQESPDRMIYQLRLIAAEITQTAQEITQMEVEQKEPSADLDQKLNDLITQQKDLLMELIRTAPDKTEPQVLQAVCLNYVRKEKTDYAVALLDAYLARQTDSPALKALRAMIDEPNLKAIPTERFTALQIEAIQEDIEDPQQRAMAVAGVYRSAGDLDKAVEWFKTAVKENPENSDEAVRAQFNIAIDREDVNAAEELWPKMRSGNLDGCEGNLAAAQVELIKKNYTLALRRVDESLAIKPLNSFAYYLKSRIYSGLDNAEEAVKSGRQAIQMDPLNGQYYKNYAALLFDRNNRLGARATIEQKNELVQAITAAITLNPNDWQLQSVYAEVIRQQSPDRALAIRKRLLKNHPSAANAVMLGNMALEMAKEERDVTKRSGLVQLSGQAYLQALSEEPDNEDAKTAYADYLRQTRQQEKAEELLQDDKNLLWRYYLQNSQYDKARELLDELYQADPQDTSVLRGLVLTAQGAGNRDEYKRYLDLLAAMDQDKDGELWILQKYLDAGYADDAAGKLASFKERYPNEKVVLLLEALYQMNKGMLSDALTLTNRYLESDANNAGAWRLRGRLYRLTNQLSKAVEDLQRSKSLQPDSAVSMELATLYTEMQQPDAAIGELVSGIEGATQVPMQMRLMLESLYKSTNRLNDLENFYKQNIEQFSGSPFWTMRAGQFYLSQNKPAQALPFLKHTWELLRRYNAIDPTALNLYLEALLQNGLYNDLFSVASGMIDSPLAPIAYAHMAKAQFKQGDKDKAESFFNSAMDKSGAVDLFQDMVLSMMIQTVGPDTAARWVQKNPEALPNLLLAYRLAISNQQFNRAIELIDKCLSLTDPETPEWNNFTLKKANLLVQAYVKTADRGYMTRAIEVFEGMLDRYPNNPSVLNNLSYLLSANDEQIEKAVDYARRAHQADPGNATYLDTYAYALYKDGQFEEAKRNVLRALQLFEASHEPVPWDAYNHLGLIYEALGDSTQAIENFNKALEVGKQAPENDRKAIEDRIARLREQTNL